MALVHDNDLACMDVAVCLVICRSRYPPDPCSRRQPFIRMDSWDTSRNLRQRFNNFSAVSYWLYHSMSHCTEGIYTKELLSVHKSGLGAESADAAAAKVATLSDHPFEAPREGSVLPSYSATIRQTSLKNPSSSWDIYNTGMSAPGPSKLTPTASKSFILRLTQPKQTTPSCSTICSKGIVPGTLLLTFNM